MRRPVRRDRVLSPDAIDDDRDALELEAEQALDRRRDGGPDLCGEWTERLPGSRDHGDANENAAVAEADVDGRGEEQPAPQRTGATDALDPWHLERRETDHLGDDAATDGESRSAHDAASAGTGSGDDDLPPSDSAMSSGTRARAVRAPTSTAYAIIRRFARPWVMITVPLTPSSGEPPTRS